MRDDLKWLGELARFTRDFGNLRVRDSYLERACLPMNPAIPITRFVIEVYGNQQSDDISQPRPGECQDATVLARDAVTGEPRMFMVPIK